MIMIVILYLKIFCHTLVNYDKNNKCIYYVMKFPYFLELIIMLVLNINVIILYKNKVLFSLSVILWNYFNKVMSPLTTKNIRVID